MGLQTLGARPVPHFPGRKFQIGHRGGDITAEKPALPSMDQRPAIAPENTLPAFEAAARAGADSELDVYATRDGHVVVHHDERLGRMFRHPQGLRKRIAEMTLAEVKQARFHREGFAATAEKLHGRPLPALAALSCFDALHIPELREVLAQFPDTHFYVELKTIHPRWSRHPNNGLEGKVVDLIREKNLYRQVTVISFSPLSLRRVKALDPDIQTALNCNIPPWLRHHAGLLQPFLSLYVKNFVRADALHPSYGDTTPEVVRQAHQAGLPVRCWVSGAEDRAAEKALFPTLIALGVDGITTNALDLLQKAVDEAARPPASPWP